MQTIGERLKELRKKRGITQIQMAELLNVDKSTIAKYEVDMCTPSLTMAITLAKFFKVSLDYLAKGEEW